MTVIDEARSDRIGVGAPEIHNQYARGGETLSSAPIIIGVGDGRLAYCFKNGKVALVQVFDEPMQIQASSEE